MQPGIRRAAGVRRLLSGFREHTGARAAGILDCNALTETSSPGSREPERAATS
jgi:hypothetical protein